MYLSRLGLVFLALAAICAPAVAQEVEAAETSLSADSLSGFRNGYEMGAQRGVVSHFTVAFLGGASLGLLAPFTLDRLDGGSAPAFASAAIIGATLLHAGREVDLPPEAASKLHQASDGYRGAFRQGYVDRVRESRRAASLVGAVAGTGVGFAAVLVYALMQIQPG